MKLFYNSIKLFMVSIIIMANVSCNNDTNPVNPIAEEIIAPNTYLFQRGGESTVSYGGQTARLDMAESLMAQLEIENVSSLDLETMFDEGTGFTDEALNSSGKKLGNKTAAYGDESVLIKIRGFLTEYADVVSTSFNTDAAAGVAGSYSNPDRTVRVNGKGMELDQVFAKSLIGALVMDQVD